MTAIQKFYRRGVSKLWWCPSVADLDAPTTAEIAAGVNVTPGLQALGGFSSRKSKIDTPDADSDFIDNIPGEVRPEDSSLTYYETKLTDEIRTTLEEDTVGVFVYFPKGKVATYRCETWPSRLGEWNTLSDLTGNVAATEVIDIFHTAKPHKNAVTPAA